MGEVFADTSYFIALLGPDVAERRRAVHAMAARRDGLVTTAWVLVELGNFLSPARHRAEFLNMVRVLAADPTTVTRNQRGIDDRSPFRATRFHRAAPTRRLAVATLLQVQITPPPVTASIF